MSKPSSGSSRRGRAVADPSWYENEFNAGDMMMDPTTGSSSSNTLEDDPLNILNPNDHDYDYHYGDNNHGPVDPIVEAGNYRYSDYDAQPRGMGDNADSDGGEVAEIIQRKDAGGVGRHAVRKYLWLTAAFVVFILVVIVPIAVVVPRNKQAAAANSSGSSTSTSTDPNSPSTSTSTGKLQDPPSELSQWCSSTDPSSADYVNCRTYCHMSECCQIPSNVPDSCLDPNDASITTKCFSYQQSCMLMQANWGDSVDGGDFVQPDDDDDLFQNYETGSTSVPVAPANLNDLCNPSYFSSNTIVRLCAQNCAPAQCCWKSSDQVESCATNANCDGYAQCTFLTAHNNVNSKIQQTVLQLCQASAVAENRQACSDVCQVAKCCFVTGDEADTADTYTDENDCFGKPDGFCEQYAGCSVLMDKIQGASDDAVGFDDVGLEVDPNTGDLQPYAEDGPMQDDPFENADNYTLKSPPPEMKYVCDPQLIYNYDDSVQQCQDLCIDASCCYLPSLDPNSCLDTHLDVCMQYRAYCDAVFAPQNETVTDASNTTTLDVADTAYLQDVCSPYSLSTPPGMKVCAQQCEPAACCFGAVVDPTTDEYRQCRSQENCDSYAPCLNLQALTPSGNDAAQESIPVTIQDMCADLSTQEGLASCQSVCMQHRCCFEDDWECVSAIQAYPGVDEASLQAACELYTGCATLFQGGNSSEADLWGGSVMAPQMTADQLSAACDESRLANLDTEECRDACAGADCCELPENIPGSCLMNNYDTCMMYHKECSAMTVGVAQDVNVAVPVAPQELVAFCSVASLATEYGRKKCQEDCALATCCWSTTLESGTVSCRDDANCPDYAPCLALAASETQNDAITQVVEQSCTVSDAQGQQAIQDLAVCRSVCLQHRCCWYAGEDDTSCFGDDACNQYDGCSWLIENP